MVLECVNSTHLFQMSEKLISKTLCHDHGAVFLENKISRQSHYKSSQQLFFQIYYGLDNIVEIM